MSHNKARLAGGGLAAIAVALAAIALLPRVFPATAPRAVSAGADTAAGVQMPDAQTSKAGMSGAPGSEADITDGTALSAPPAAADDAARASTDPDEDDAIDTAQDGVTSGPTVDTFLLGPDGVAVVAGKASPGATVSVLLDGTVIGEAQADSRGGFAATADIVAATVPRRLTFAENGGLDSGDTVLVRPETGGIQDRPNPQVAPVLADASQPATQSSPVDSASAQPAPVDTGTLAVESPAPSANIVAPAGPDGTDMAHAGAPSDRQSEMPIQPDVASGAPALDTAAALAVEAPQPVTGPAPTVVIDAQGARVLGAGPQAMDRVALDAITYDDVGDVQLAGRAPGGGSLQVYVDNRPVATGPVGPQGDWRITLPQVDAGTYTLRVDEIAADGRVTSRIETPFQRTAPEELARLQSATGPAAPVTQTVQPGNTLWAIAKDNFGDGLLYVSLFEANADQIRNPDLIYPGQVFVIPKP